ncbi:uncharacterized protein A4U43_C09F3830 [Asparagus officinalis]|uniref:GST N-terminal domain-containing protein n=1 Tax=Asparagus officinalis TaxID=4686 RepID=A0A5P1E541_ASPOF|nr:uncharacterized protein LOC109824688 [Asparagus officinalis]ONK57762.1 uncharacterized protein A4U43_C09F3830 [Asparagus officinalis]
MLLLSLAHSFPLSEAPDRFPSQHSKIPSSRTKSPSGFLRFPSERRFHAKSARTEDDSIQNPPISPGTGSPAASSFLSVLCPLLKFFGGGDPSQERNDLLEVATSSLSSLARLPWGSRTSISTTQSIDSTANPPKLQLYEFEACPFCRRVREAMTELDLSAEVYPCPKGSVRHREIVRKIGGQQQFPFLVDLNTGVSLYESGDIVKYLFQQYGQGRNASFGLLESTVLTGWVPTLLRAGRGMTTWERAKPDAPTKLLELFSYENNAYARIVREALCELELPYILHNVGEGSSKYELLVKESSSKEIPYLVDPNTGVKMGDYKKILSYLFQTYSKES